MCVYVYVYVYMYLYMYMFIYIYTCTYKHIAVSNLPRPLATLPLYKGPVSNQQ